MKKILIAAAFLLFGAAIATAAEKAADKNIKVIDLKFSENMKFLWPFSSPSVKDLGTTVDMTRNDYGAKLLNKDVKFELEEDGSCFVINASRYMLSNPRLGLRLGGKTTVKLPVVKGMSLVCVKLSSASPSSFGKAFLAEADATTPTAGCEAVKKNVNEVNWNLADPKPGVQYSILQIYPKSGMDLKGLTLIYAKKAIPSVYALTTAKAQDGDGTYETLKASFTPLFADASDFTCGFEYKLADAKKWTNVECERPKAKFSQKVTGLKAQSNYVYRAWVCAPNSKKKVYGEEVAFSTAETVVSVNFTTLTLAQYGMPGSREAYSRNGGKIGSSKLGSDIEFKFWGEYGVAVATNGGKPFALSLNPSKKLKDGTFDFGGQGNAWLKLPGLENKKLVKVEIKFPGFTEGEFNLSSEVVEGKGNKDIADTFKATKNAKDFSFETTTLEKGQACYLCAENASSAFITEIKLTYSF